MWRRDEELRVESAVDAERFIEDVGFAKLRSLTPSPLLVGRGGPAYADRCPSRWFIVVHAGTFAKRASFIPGGKALYGELLASGRERAR